MHFHKRQFFSDKLKLFACPFCWLQNKETYFASSPERSHHITTEHPTSGSVSEIWKRERQNWKNEMPPPSKKPKFQSVLEEVQKQLKPQDIYDVGDKDFEKIRIEKIEIIEKNVWEARIIHKDNQESLDHVTDKLSKYSDLAGCFKFDMKKLCEWKNEVELFFQKT